MKKQFDTIIGVDPGVSGGISVVYPIGIAIPYKIPVETVTVNKKNKKRYDTSEIIEILKPYRRKRILFVQEKVASHPGEGSVSAFNFGRSVGLTIGIAEALGFKVIEVSSQRWKKHFPPLNTTSIIKKKEEIKELRQKGKRLKDKKAKKENKKSIEKLNRQIKTEAKDAARALVSKLYPNMADQFEKKNTDGMAESLLIAIYGKDNQNELVQNS